MHAGRSPSTGRCVTPSTTAVRKQTPQKSHNDAHVQTNVNNSLKVVTGTLTNTHFQGTQYNMLHMVMRQRRRFAFALLLTQLAFIGVVPQGWILLLMILGIFVGFGLISATGHPLRRLMECGSIGLLASTRMPSLTLIVVVFVATTIGAYVLFYSGFMDRFPLRIGMRSRKSFVVALDGRTTWSKLIPGQGHVAAYWTGTMTSARRDAHDDETLYLSFDQGHDQKDEVTVTYLNMVPTTEATYLLERDTQLPGEEIIMTYKIKQTDEERTEISSDMRVSGLPIRLATERFFDDVLGDELDSFAMMTECRRSWSLKDAGDAALTTDLGRDMVRLNLDTPEAEAHPNPRMSA